MGRKVIAIPIRGFGRYDPSVIKELLKAGFRIRQNTTDKRIVGRALVRFIRDAVGVIAGTEPYTKEILQSAPVLRVISRVGSGIDNIDTEYAKKRGIKICATRLSSVSDAVAEHTLALILAKLKKIVIYDREVRQRKFRKMPGEMLRDKTVGVVGYGKVGRRVARLCRCFGAKVVVHDPYVKLSKRTTYEFTTLKKLLSVADVVSLHVPYSEETKNLIGEPELNLMKKSAILVNTSRGGIVDESALYSALKEKKIAGAALDVFSSEPYVGPLAKLENVILTPHVASNTVSTRIQMEKEAVKNLLDAFKNTNLG